MKKFAGILVLGCFLLAFSPYGLWGQERSLSVSLSPRYVASRFSIRYHQPNCKKVLKIQGQNRITFSNVKEATDAGYMPCPRCKPPGQK
ncbi:MAG: hypothetical protein EHM36_05600 [Deltaproteobacteria bacterium]|nr:MAG: hypothetical protein EHM36_05600 [Deltaproteobacteria bacterium]